MRVASVSNLFKQTFTTLEFDGVYEAVFGSPSDNGAWLIYGNEKNGKTTLALMLSEYMSNKKRILYISAEQGYSDPDFVSACKRVGLKVDNRKLGFLEYTEVEDIEIKLSKRRSADIIFIDNCTIYKDVMTSKIVKKLLAKFPTKLFVFIAHEERNEPYSALAKYIAKIAKVIMHVEGLACNCYGRIPGGMILIDETLSKLYHGNNIAK